MGTYVDLDVEVGTRYDENGDNVGDAVAPSPRETKTWPT